MLWTVIHFPCRCLVNLVNLEVCDAEFSKSNGNTNLNFLVRGMDRLFCHSAFFSQPLPAVYYLVYWGVELCVFCIFVKTSCISLFPENYVFNFKMYCYEGCSCSYFVFAYFTLSSAGWFSCDICHYFMHAVRKLC